MRWSYTQELRNRSYRIWQSKLDFSEIQAEALKFETEDGFGFGENPETDFGIFRIIDMQAYLSLYAQEHPEFSTQISVEDKVLPENSGLYQIQNGSVTKSTGKNENCRSKPAEILQKMPISGGKVLKIAVVSRQH